MGFMEIPVFSGDSEELRSWISWMEDRFVRDNFTELQKLNLAHGFIEGDAEAHVQWRRSFMPIQTWEELKRVLLSRFGKRDDPERMRIKMETDRVMQQMIKKRRDVQEADVSGEPELKKDAENFETKMDSRFDSIEALLKQIVGAKVSQQVGEDDTRNVVDRQKLTVNNSDSVHIDLDSPEERSDIDSRKEDRDSLVRKVVMPVFEGSDVFRCEDLSSPKMRIHVDVDVMLKTMDSSLFFDRNVAPQFQILFGSEMETYAHQVLDQMILQGYKLLQHRKMRKFPKSWMFKFKKCLEFLYSAALCDLRVDRMGTQTKSMLLKCLEVRDSSKSMDQLQSPSVLVDDDLQSGFRSAAQFVLPGDQFSVFHVDKVDALPHKSLSVKAKQTAHHMFDDISLPTALMKTKNKLRKYFKSWHFKFKKKSQAKSKIGETILLCMEAQLISQESVKVLFKDSFKFKSGDLTQFLLGGTLFQLKHKWRSKLLLSRVGKELCVMESATSNFNLEAMLIQKQKPYTSFRYRWNPKEPFTTIYGHRLMFLLLTIHEWNHYLWDKSFVRWVTRLLYAFEFVFKLGMERKIVTWLSQIMNIQPAISASMFLALPFRTTALIGYCNRLDYMAAWSKAIYVNANLPLLELHGVTIECQRSLTSVFGCESEAVLECEAWQENSDATVSDLGVCWNSLGVFAIGDANLDYSAWGQQSNMVQLIFGVEIFQIKQKWRFKLLNPVSGLELSLESAAYVAFLAEHFSEHKPLFDEAGTSGENLQLLATVLHIYAKQNQLATTNIFLFGQDQFMFIRDILKAWFSVTSRETIQGDCSQSYLLVPSTDWSTKMLLKIARHCVWHRWKARYSRSDSSFFGLEA